MLKKRIMAVALATIMTLGASVSVSAGVGSSSGGGADVVVGSDYYEPYIDINKPVLLSNEQLLEMAYNAPGHWLTRSENTLTDRHITDEELADWIYEYSYRGGANAFELEVIRLINIERGLAGLDPLSVERRLMMSARFKSQEMVDLDYFCHTSPVYGWFTVIPIQLFDARHIISENLSGGVTTPEGVVAAWMRSPGHRANMLREYAVTLGVGRVGNATTMMIGR